MELKKNWFIINICGYFYRWTKVDIMTDLYDIYYLNFYTFLE